MKKQAFIMPKRGKRGLSQQLLINILVMLGYEIHFIKPEDLQNCRGRKAPINIYCDEFIVPNDVKKIFDKPIKK